MGKEEQKSKNKNIHTELIITKDHIKTNGINEIKRSNDGEILAKLSDTSLTILGQELSITKIDIESGFLEADGKIKEVIYGSKQNIFRRIFK